MSFKILLKILIKLLEQNEELMVANINSIILDGCKWNFAILFGCLFSNVNKEYTEDAWNDT